MFNFNASPTTQQNIGAALMQQGQYRGPEHHWMQGASRMASMLAGAYLQNRGQKGRADMMQAALAKADTAGSPSERISILANELVGSGDPRLAEIGMNQQVEGLKSAAKYDREDRVSEREHDRRKDRDLFQADIRRKEEAARQNFRMQMLGARNASDRTRAMLQHQLAMTRLGAQHSQGLERLRVGADLNRETNAQTRDANAAEWDRRTQQSFDNDIAKMERAAEIKAAAARDAARIKVGSPSFQNDLAAWAKKRAEAEALAYVPGGEDAFGNVTPSVADDRIVAELQKFYLLEGQNWLAQNGSLAGFPDLGIAQTAEGQRTGYSPSAGQRTMISPQTLPGAGQ